ncbi:MAG TPA: aldehyde dehydrogenase family protein, partial [Planctomycetota bacterium]|nr:aldehyde dehydrogenase family protein [Planctomycetota bacterium]
RCTGVKRVLVVPEVADALIAKVKAGVEKLGVGDPREPGVVVGPVVSDRSADYVTSLIDDALGKGAKALLGPKRQGRLLWPTLLDHVTEAMRIAWEEPFGPALPILRARDMEDAVRIANASEFGLQSCVFTRDIDRAFHVGRELQVGTCNINGADSRGPDHFPFMGCKSSGMLTQGIHYSISAMTRDRAITLNLRAPRS